MSLPAQVWLTWDTVEPATHTSGAAEKIGRHLAAWSCHTTSVQQRELSLQEEHRADTNPRRLLPGDSDRKPFFLCSFPPCSGLLAMCHSLAHHALPQDTFIRSFYDCRKA